MKVTYEEDDWDDFGADGDTFASCIYLEDNFAMNSKQGNDKGVDFYVLICTKTMFIVSKPCTCPWDNNLMLATYVLRGSITISQVQ
jgi:hypothetical protein